MPLPFKTGKLSLPNNRQMALNRLNNLRRRFTSDQTYKEHYRNFMQEVIDKGFAEEVPEAELSKNDGTVWYIPHHGVYHPKKPGRIRVVFDASAKFQGSSLNNSLLQGPDLTNNLTGVLCRFRKETVAFMCDIEGMFHQVIVRPDHRNFLRFLFWEGGDPEKSVKEYRMAVHLFGATSSPACSNFALKRTADDYEEEFGSEVANFVRNDFYVDDGLKSVETVKEANELIKKTKAMCQKGGFNLHKFTCNNKEVIEGLPREQRAKNIQEIDLKGETLPIDRALGVQWCVQSDQFQFRIELKDKPLTRRSILSTVSSIFDPLGLVAPFVLKGKRILQQLCKDSIGWDERIPDDLRAEWEKWREDLRHLEDLRIPRCYKPTNFGKVESVELHSFSDASLVGYGQCSYLRIRNHKGEIHCSLVMAKSRVTPLKPVTVPRLELAAALVSVNISAFLKGELAYSTIPEMFYSDSKVVLGYIGNDARRFHTYVANRVQQIRDHTTPSQWKYIQTADNPADEASRGMGAQELINNARWWNGPAFLWTEIEDSANNEMISNIPDDDPEVKRASAFRTKTEEQFNLLDRVKRFSDWHQVRSGIAAITKFQQRIKLRSQNEADDKPNVDVKAIKLAESEILRAEQLSNFKEEIEALRNQDKGPATVRKSSPLYRLDPFLDDEGVLRVGGRLSNTDVAFNIKHPAILPKKGHVTELVIRHFHTRTSHQGRPTTHAEIRASGYWIIGGASVVGLQLSKCVTCRRSRGALEQQKMADLPDDRVKESPPFTYSAVDYFGPWLIKEGRKELKRYGVLFTCMNSRAIHLETASSLTTDSFMNAYRRFIGRRGPVRQLRSDQGTNLMGARNELHAAMAEIQHDRIRSKLLRDECDWVHFKPNVPHASHMGGVWERQIRTVRSVLTTLLRNHGTQLDDKSLRTLMVEAESIVNCRPLTTTGSSPSDSVEVLTPNQLLTQKSKIVLPPPGNFQQADLYARKRWLRVQHLANQFWTRWRKDFLYSLQERQKWEQPRKNLEIGDVVILKDENQSRSQWRLARVAETFPSDDGLVRKVRLKMADNSKGTKVNASTYLDRPIHKLVLLVRGKEQ